VNALSINYVPQGVLCAFAYVLTHTRALSHRCCVWRS
jgi:hypothetical protein